MKKEMSSGAVMAVIALMLVAVIALFMFQGRPPATPEDAGAGLPAKAGGGTVDPAEAPAGSRPGGP